MLLNPTILQQFIASIVKQIVKYSCQICESERCFSFLEIKKNLTTCVEKFGIYKLFMVENLCPVYRNLMDKYLHLKRTRALHNVWSHNGIVAYKKSSHGYPVQPLHEEDFTYYFSNGQYLDKYYK